MPLFKPDGVARSFTTRRRNVERLVAAHNASNEKFATKFGRVNCTVGDAAFKLSFPSDERAQRVLCQGERTDNEVLVFLPISSWHWPPRSPLPIPLTRSG